MSGCERLRFEGFEVDASRRTVCKDGKPIHLNPRTFDLLLYLASNAQRVISKDELMRALWPNSFVEESNLSQHMFLLRKAIAEAGNGLRVVVTLPGRGYQFSARVERVPDEDGAKAEAGQPHPQSLAAQNGGVAAPGGNLILHAVESVTRVTVEEEFEEDGDRPQKELAAGQRPALAGKVLRKPRVWWVLAGGAAVIMLAAAGGWLLWRRAHAVTAAPLDAVLAEMTNSTGDADFDGALQPALQIDLEQSPFVSLMPAGTVQETLAEMHQAKDTKLSPEVAHEICVRNNAPVLILSSISRLGSKYTVLLDAQSCVSGKMLAGARADASSKDGVLSALDAAAGRLRRQLGEAPASVDRFQIPVAQASTSSLDALRAFSLAQELNNHGDEKGAQTQLEHAVELDPSFAYAYSGLAVTYYNRGDFARASELYKKAFDLRSHTTERERLTLEIAYYANSLNDYEQAIRSLHSFLAIYPQNSNGWGNLCNLYTQLGEYSQAIEAGQRALQVDPRARISAEQLARALKRAGRLTEAMQAANTAIVNGRDSWGVHSILFQIAFAQHNAAAIQSEGQWGLTHQHANQSLNDLGFAAATSGKLTEALDDFARSQAESHRGNDTDYAESVRNEVPGVLIELGESQRAQAALKPIATPENDPSLSFDHAALGNLAPAEKLLANVDPNSSSTVLMYSDLPWLRAEVALKSRKPLEAIRLLEPARPYQLRDFGVPTLRAEAETEAGQLDAAAADYRLVLANQGVDPISPQFPLAHLRLARVLVRLKKLDEARQEYRAFLECWKDADPDLKLYQDAKREYAALAGTAEAK
jgi:DNA-binding winged helix-turn-helix (wHTH) protein/tetratricopeptide (TPR) repeat protein